MLNRRMRKSMVLTAAVAACIIAGGCGDGGAKGPVEPARLGVRLELPRSAFQSFSATYEATVSVLTMDSSGNLQGLATNTTTLTMATEGSNMRFTGSVVFPDLTPGTRYLCKVVISGDNGASSIPNIVTAGGLVRISEGGANSVTVSSPSSVAALSTMMYAVVAGIGLSEISDVEESAIRERVNAANSSDILSFFQSYLMNTSAWGGSSNAVADAFVPANWSSISGLSEALADYITGSLYYASVTLLKVFDSSAYNQSISNYEIVVLAAGRRLASVSALTPESETLTTTKERSLPASGAQIDGAAYFGDAFAYGDHENDFSAFENRFPDGAYTVSYTMSETGSAILKSITLPASYPSDLEISSPSWDSTITTTTPSFAWSSTGATLYNLCIIENQSGFESGECIYSVNGSTATTLEVPVGVLQTEKNYFFRVEAMATSAGGFGRKGLKRRVKFSVASSSSPTDEERIRNVFDVYKTAINNEDSTSIANQMSDGFINNGMTKSSEVSMFQDLFSASGSFAYDCSISSVTGAGSSASAVLAGNMTAAFSSTKISSCRDALAAADIYFIKESGVWKIYGNQAHGYSITATGDATGSILIAATSVGKYVASWALHGGSLEYDYTGLDIDYFVTATPALNDSWTLTSTDNGYQRVILNTISSVSDTVVTDAGTFNNCVRVTRSYTYPEGYDSDFAQYQTITKTDWFAPAVGLVKYSVTHGDFSANTVELTSYTAPSASPTDFYPMAIGNSWTYQNLDGSWTLTVSGVDNYVP